jgi:hypothetical protein
MRVVLQPRNPDELNSFITAASSPSSADYRHFLSRGKFAARFGPTSQAIDAVRTALRRDGLSVVGLSASHLVMDVDGTAQDFGRALRTSFSAWQSHDGGVGYAMARPARLPAAIAADIAGIAGTSSFDVEHSSALRRTPRRSGPDHATVAGVAGPALGTHTSHGTGPVTCTMASNAVAQDYQGTYLPSQEGQAYGLTTPWQDDDVGTGLSVALVEFAPYARSDVLSYDHCFELIQPGSTSDPNLRNVLVDGGTSPGSAVASDEPTLDIEQVRALAPGAQVVVYEGPNDVVGPIDTLQQIATADASQIVSTSWGLCEQFSDHAAETPIFEEMAAQGQTVFAAAGDNGSSDCLQQTPPGAAALVAAAVDDPASQPLVTGVGGLTVSSLSPLAESVWNDCSQPNDPNLSTGCLGNAGGGGVSSVYPHPAWQAGQGVPTGAQRGASGRDVPDLSVIGDPYTGMLVYFQGTYQAYGGTSMGAPLMAAVEADAAQVCGTKDFGFLNPLLYAMGRHGGDFDDVTQGTNEIAASTVQASEFAATPGYDLASGLGSPDPSNFVDALCDATASASASSTTPGAANVKWTVTFHTGSEAYPAGTTRVSLTAPPGTAFSPLTSSWDVTTAAGTDAPTAVALSSQQSATDNVATITLQQSAPPVGLVTVVARAVTNPDTVGTTSVKVGDSIDALSEQAPLSLASDAPSSVQLTTGGGAHLTVPIGGPGLDVAVRVGDSTGAAVAGTPLVATASGGAVARLATPTTNDVGAATVLLRDVRPETATLEVVADGGAASGSVQVTFVDPWSAIAAQDAAGVGHVVDVPSVVGTTTGGTGFVGLTRNGDGRLVLVRSIGTATLAAPLSVPGNAPLAGSAPTLVRLGGLLVASYRSTRGDLVVCTSPVSAPTRPWQVLDLTARHVAPRVTGSPSLIVVGAGSAARLSLAAVDRAREIISLSFRASEPLQAHVTDVSALADGQLHNATGNVAQAALHGAAGYFVRTTSNRLYFYVHETGGWAADDLAQDAQLLGAPSVDLGDPTATVQSGMAVVAVTDADHNVVYYVGTLGNWSAQVLDSGPDGTSAPAGERLPPFIGQITLSVQGSTTEIFCASSSRRLYELTSFGVADPWSSYDLTTLTHVRATTAGATLLPGAATTLLGTLNGRLYVLRDPR